MVVTTKEAARLNARLFLQDVRAGIVEFYIDFTMQAEPFLQLPGAGEKLIQLIRDTRDEVWLPKYRKAIAIRVRAKVLEREAAWRFYGDVEVVEEA